MKKLLATALLLTAGLSTSANAAFISGNQVTNGGKTVNLQGLEWMPLTYTAGLSRNQVESAGGFTDRFGGVWNAGDWRYATLAETTTLLGSLWGGVYHGYAANNYDGAIWFLEHFGALAYDTGFGAARVDRFDTDAQYPYFDYTSFYFGAKNDCNADSTYTCFGRVAAVKDWIYAQRAFNTITKVNSELSSNAGDDVGLFWATPNAEFQLSINSSTQYNYDGSLLVRNTANTTAPVSTPNAFSLLALGLGGLIFYRRRKTL